MFIWDKVVPFARATPSCCASASDCMFYTPHFKMVNCHMLHRFVHGNLWLSSGGENYGWGQGYFDSQKMNKVKTLDINK